MNEPEAALHSTALNKSAGTLLREAREAAGLHVGALAVSLKVPVKKLEALEADDLDRLPDAVFARALAATVCRTLKIDPEPVLARLPQFLARPLKVGSQETPVRLDSGRGLRLPGSGGMPRSVVYLTGVLLLGAIVVGLMPTLRIGGDAEVAQAPDNVAIRTVPHALTLPTDATPGVVPAAPVATESAAVLPAGAVASEPVSTTVPAASQTTPLAALTATAPTVGANEAAIVVFQARQASWVQVVDAAGLVHLRKTLGADETVRINGTLPLSVVIGRANAIDVVVRGKPFDLAPAIKDNVARFQIK